MKPAVVTADGQENIPFTTGLPSSPQGAFTVGVGAINLSAAHKPEERRLVQDASADGEAPARQGGGRPGREGAMATDTYETREEAEHVPMPALAAAQENVGATADAQIVAQVQNELIRLGCYNGPADNDWGAASGRALRKVSRLANLRLRSTQPSLQTLTALRGVSGAPCGGQRRDDAGAGQPVGEAAKRQDRLPGQNSAGPAGQQAKGQTEEGGSQGGASSAPDSKSYLPPWMQGSQAASAEAETPPVERAERAERAEETRRRRFVSPKRTTPPPRTARAAPRSNGGWRVRQRHRAEPTSQSWSFFLFH